MLRKFQFTPLREGRLCGLGVTGTARLFQFTPLREGRRDCGGGGKSRGISIHAPPRGATLEVAQNGGCCDFDFNSRPSARGDGREIHQRLGILPISIHAPPRGATSRRRLIVADTAISIHAPPRGATCGGVSCVLSHRFQFTPLREGRPVAVCLSQAVRGFQFTPLREGRQSCLLSPFAAILFQFTPLREGRRG